MIAMFIWFVTLAKFHSLVFKFYNFGKWFSVYCVSKTLVNGFWFLILLVFNSQIIEISVSGFVLLCYQYF